jgi:RNA polymerase sigma-70 factor (ECF subfamily)
MVYEGFEQWYAIEHTRLINSMFAVSGSVDAAKEATDEAFARALERWPRVAAMASPTAWTYRVALNVLRRRMRRRRKEIELLSRARRDPVEAPLSVHQWVWSAIGKLSLHQRQAIVLRYVADMTEEQIGEVLRRPRGTVASDLSRARATLAGLLGDSDVMEVSGD